MITFISDRHHNVQLTNHIASQQLIGAITNKLAETVDQINTNKNNNISNFENYCQDKFGELERNAIGESSSVHNTLTNVIKLVENLDDLRQKDLHNFHTLKVHFNNWVSLYFISNFIYEVFINCLVF